MCGASLMKAGLTPGRAQSPRLIRIQMPPKRNAAAAAKATETNAVENELAVSHEKPAVDSISPCQTIYIKNLNERIRKQGIDL